MDKEENGNFRRSFNKVSRCGSGISKLDKQLHSKSYFQSQICGAWAQDLTKFSSLVYLFNFISWMYCRGISSFVKAVRRHASRINGSSDKES